MQEKVDAAVQLAQAASVSAGYLSAGIGAGIALIGGGLGLGRIAASANEGIARQPEAAGEIKGISIIFAAMLEGAILFGIVVCLLLALK